jgi:uncharacterized membrane protein
MAIVQKTLGERMAHAVGFEALALVICAPIGAWLLDRPLLHMGALSVILSTVAMLWNIIYNSVFDRFWPAEKITRTLPIRAIHALGFEGGFILIGLPIATALLGITLLHAFVVEIGFFLFFLPYTMFYNWMYDTLRVRWVAANGGKFRHQHSK